MEQDIEVLASSAATTLVQMMTGDAWRQAKAQVTSLWRRLRPAQADEVKAELEAARQGLLATGTTHDGPPGPALAHEWAIRLRDLAVAEPAAAAVLLDLAAALRRSGAGAQEPPAVRVEMRAKASGRARVFQAGRDQEING